MAGKKQRKKMTRKQVVLYNLTIIVIACGGIFFMRNGSFTETQAYQKGLEAFGLTEETVRIVRQWQYEEAVPYFLDPYNKDKRVVRDVFLETTIGEEPALVRLSVCRTGFFRYEHQETVSYLKLYDRGLQSGFAPGVVMEDGEICLLQDEGKKNNRALFLGIWDYPQLGARNMMVISDLKADGVWQVTVDCLDVDLDEFEETGRINLDVFAPELVYTVDKESGEVTIMTVSEECKALGMTLTEEEAGKLAMQMVKTLNWEI